MKSYNVITKPDVI